MKGKKLLKQLNENLNGVLQLMAHQTEQQQAEEQSQRQGQIWGHILAKLEASMAERLTEIATQAGGRAGIRAAAAMSNAAKEPPIPSAPTQSEFFREFADIVERVGRKQTQVNFGPLIGSNKAIERALKDIAKELKRGQRGSEPNAYQIRQDALREVLQAAHNEVQRTEGDEKVKLHRNWLTDLIGKLRASPPRKVAEPEPEPAMAD